MMAYVDTNVILAKYLPNDRYHKRSTAFLELADQVKMVSPVTVVELMAIASRRQEDVQAPEEILQERPARRVRALVEFFLKDSNLVVTAVNAQARTKMAGSVVTVPLEYVNSIRLAHSLKLRTLDLIHLAYAQNIRRSGQELDSFVTTDEGILNKSGDIESLLGIKVKEPYHSAG